MAFKVPFKFVILNQIPYTQTQEMLNLDSRWNIFTIFIINPKKIKGFFNHGTSEVTTLVESQTMICPPTNPRRIPERSK